MHDDFEILVAHIQILLQPSLYDLVQPTRGIISRLPWVVRGDDGVDVWRDGGCQLPPTRQCRVWLQPENPQRKLRVRLPRPDRRLVSRFNQ